MYDKRRIVRFLSFFLFGFQKNSKTKKRVCKMHTRCFGVPEGIRTPDLLVRSQTLYPAELQAQTYLLHKLPNYNIIINIKRQAFF